MNKHATQYHPHRTWSARALRAWQFIREHYPLELFPLRRNLRGYTKDKFASDVRAGLNVALLAIPQSMAYAMIAGLPVRYGIFCAAIAPLIAACFCGSRLTSVGPTNATAVMVLSVYLNLPRSVDPLMSLSLLTFLVGAFLIIGSYLKVAELTQYVSRSVVIGYITGAACLIVAHQAHYVFGVEVGHSPTFIDVIGSTITALPHTHPETLLLSIMTFAIWYYVTKRWPKLPNVGVAILVASLAAFLLSLLGAHFSMLPPVTVEQWRFTPPAINSAWISQLFSGALAVAFLASLENTFMAKTLANRTGERIDVNQEMFGLGVSNIVAGSFSGMPASGSPSRSALAWASGALTPMAGICCGVICGVAAPVLGTLLVYVPQSALAVVVIATAFGLIDKRQIFYALRATKSDAAVLLTSFIAALVAPLDTAIFLGVALSIVLFLRQASSPHLAEYTFNDAGQLAELHGGKQRSDPQISIIHVEGELFFGAADLFRDEIRRVCMDGQLRVVILRMKRARHMDATTVMALAELINFLRETDRHLIISGATREVYKVVRDSGLLDLLGRDNFFLTTIGNPNVSTRKALKRAQELMGRKSAPVRIFYDPEKVEKKETAASAAAPSVAEKKAPAGDNPKT